MKFKKVLALTLGMVMMTGLLAGCGSESESSDDGGAAASSAGKVYYLNFKPEDAETFEEIAEVFKDETGIEIEVMTAASGTYESTLKSEIAKTDAPTLFHINGINGYESWKDYTDDLSDSDFYSYLTDSDLAVSTDDGVFGIATTVEGYGIICNTEIIDRYAQLDGAVVSSADEINNFATLKAVAEDLQNNKEELDIDGAFGATSLSPGEDWRWQTHLLNVPLYYEYKDRGIDDADTLEGTYLAHYKDIFDLYINNSSVEPGVLSGQSVADSMAEFALGKVAFIQNGDWGWGDIADNDVDAESVRFLPIYIGVDGEEDQGLCVGTENYWCVNAEASDADKEATHAFIDWMFNSETGKDYVINKLEWTPPFNTFDEGESPSNPLAQSILEYSESGKTVVDWVFETMPSQTYKDNVGAALLEYAQGTNDWENVESAVIDGWASEKESPTAAEDE